MGTVVTAHWARFVPHTSNWRHNDNPLYGSSNAHTSRPTSVEDTAAHIALRTVSLTLIENGMIYLGTA